MNNNKDEKFYEFKELFSLYDKDKTNYVDLANFEKIMLCMGIRLQNRKKEFDLIKQKYCTIINNAYLISFNKCMEFIKSISNLKEVEDEIIECFQNINKNGNGLLSFIELKQALLDMGEEFDDEEIEEIFHWAEPKNKEGITYEEFIKLLMAK